MTVRRQGSQGGKLKRKKRGLPKLPGASEAGDQERKKCLKLIIFRTKFKAFRSGMPYDENVAFDFHDFDQFYARIWTPGRPGTRSRPLLACQLDLPLSLEKKLAQGFSGFGNPGL